MIRGEIKVLIVEDNPAHARLINLYLMPVRETTYIAHVEDTLEGALKYLNGNPGVDIVLLDLTLPGTAGIETYRAVKLSRPDLAVLIISSSFDVDTATKAVAEGAVGYLVKGMHDGKMLHLNINLALATHQVLQLQQEKLSIKRQAWQVHHERLAKLPSIISACADCGRIKDESIEGDDPYVTMAQYLSRHNIEITHGICPTCMPKYVQKALETKDLSKS